MGRWSRNQVVRGVAALLAFAGGAAAQPLSHVHGEGCGAEGCGRAALMKRRFAEGLPPRDAFGGRELFAATDVLHNDLDIVPDYATRSIAGSNTMTIRSLVPGLSEFTFMLDTTLTVSRVVFNGTEELALPVLVGTYARRVTLPRAVAEGEEFTLRIEYGGVPVSRGFGSINYFLMNGEPTIYTLSEPWYSATWWPAKDWDVGQAGDNGDKATLEIAITVPSGMTAVSNGLLQGIDDLGDGRRKHRWKTDYPMSSYLACFAASTYTHFSDTYRYPLPGGGEGTMPLDFYVTPGADTSSLRSTWLFSNLKLTRFRPLFGEYPFVNEKYGIYQFGFSGGMEHQTMSGQSTNAGHDITTHELAHQWWGDDVTCRTWHDIWLNESFAEYAECLWAEFNSGQSNQTSLINAVNARGATTGFGSVYQYDLTNLNRVFDVGLVYHKGARVLHMLRTVLDRSNGPDAFFEVLRRYRARYSGIAATTDDFVEVVSEVAGRDMSQFFEAWIYGVGGPSIQYSGEAVVINGQQYVKMLLKQTQSGAGRPSFFPMPVEVRASYTSGRNDWVVDLGGRSSWHVLPRTSTRPLVSFNLDMAGVSLIGSQSAGTYEPGPAKVLTVSPAVGAVVETPVTSIAIGMSEVVTAGVSDFEVRRDGVPVGFTMSFDVPTLTATLAFAGPLRGGSYEVVVRDTVMANGHRLDGEMRAGMLPSGNGAPGGDAVYSFTVEGCAADFNGDGFLDFFDYGDFVTCFETGVCGESRGDFNGDGFVDFFDYGDFVGAFESGC